VSPGRRGRAGAARRVVALAAALVALAACSSEDDGAGDDGVDDAAPATGGTAVAAPDGPVAPLTGLPGADAALATRPALAVKVDATAAAEPQLGLGAADLVVEEPVEGATRLTAVFHSTDPGDVGPVRSSRPLDDDLVAPLGAVLVTSGGLPPFLDPVRAVATVWSEDEGTTGFRRLDDRDAPHDLVVDASAVWDAVGAGDPPPPPLTRLAADATFAGTGPATEVTVRYPGDVAVVTWSWDAAAGRWHGARDGRPIEGAPGEPVGVAAVVVQYVERSPQSTGVTDANGVEVVDRVLVGTGHATVFAGGQVLVAEWARTALAEPTTLRGTDGTEVAVPPGPVWWLIVPIDGQVTFAA
jgi:hypothetical protein